VLYYRGTPKYLIYTRGIRRAGLLNDRKEESMQDLRLEELTVNHIMTAGYLTELRLSPELVGLLANATRNEEMNIDTELSDIGLNDDIQHWEMPEDSEYIPVTQWCPDEEASEPSIWSIFMYKDPVTNSARMTGWMCDSHCNNYIRKIV